MLETANDAQMAWSVFFVYGDREHIRFLLRSIFVENDDQDVVDAHLGQTADLWVIENGRCVGHVDLHSLLSIHEDAGSRQVLLDWIRFDQLVPASLAGSVLRHGEKLRLLAAQEDFPDTQSNLPSLYPDTLIGYGMQVWVEGDLSDEPYEVYPDPDPAGMD
ncbi:hypothetical protein ACF082_37250 [Streptomyces lydicus]|uniref:hypothetical protein n=1 Tax=Streptomyces lydicus TaxID=47763 RepID=UPI0037016FA0